MLGELMIGGQASLEIGFLSAIIGIVSARPGERSRAWPAGCSTGS